MIKFGLVDAKQRTVELREFKEIVAAERAVGLEPGQVDFGSLTQFLHVVVYEFGLFIPKEEQHYFSIGTQMFAGNAVLFGTDIYGETVNLNKLPPVMFYKNADAVEFAIQQGGIVRPRTSVGTLGGESHTTWEWPQPRSIPRR